MLALIAWKKIIIKKILIRHSGFLRPKSQHFSPFREQRLFDNTAGICYHNSSSRFPDDDCRFSPVPPDIGMHSVTAHSETGSFTLLFYPLSGRIKL